ncbi:MAG: hypothetical protein KA375_16435 [Vitreoscilla sp.]|nr:hypothetical protein [Burkholderiales bacterium]MBP6339189.1 hypothetical protein [Vitreoscilla sp.]MBP7915308.1 hypothetical protein [Vitreoscilla sp.]
MNAAATRAALTLILSLAAGAAWAAPTTYVCEDKQVLKVTSTPFRVQVEVGTERWVATRIRAGRDAYFMNKAKGVKLLLNRSDLELQRPAGTLRCKLLPHGMPPENLYVAPYASAPGR